ncbi:UDP binding domain-containing protein [Enterococcus columbae]|uniref:UDP binding domain-containing protein n=1 Tax=Enterococcus columbae TaxID=1355 RepID=UPI003D15F794
MTFKENCSDIRNSKIIDLVQNFRSFGIFPKIYDPLGPSKELLDKYNLKLTKNALKNLDVMIVAVPHKEFHNKVTLIRMFRENKTPKILFDLKGVFDNDDFEKQNIIYWRL